MEDIDALPFSTADAEEGARNGHDSTTDNAEDIDAQAFSTTDTEEDALNGHDSTTDEDGEDIDAQAFSTNEAEEGARNGHDSTTDVAKEIEAQAFSAAKGRWGVRSPRGPDPPTDDGHDSTNTGNDFSDTGNDSTDHPLQSNAIRHAGADTGNDFTAQPSNFSADRHPPAAVGTALADDLPIFAADECRPLRPLTEKHPYLNPSFHESHPLLRLHPPSFGGFGRTFRVQSVQPPFGRPFLGRFVDIRSACTVGSRPLRPRLTRCRPARGRCRPEHADHERTTAANAAERSANAISPLADAHEHGAQCAKNADFIDADPVRGHQTERNESEHADRGCKRHDSAVERSANAIRPPADAPEHDAQCAKNADFIDADPVRRHKIDHNAPERSANAVSPLADAGEHADCGRKRHDPAPEHTARGHQTDRNESEHPDRGRKRHDLAPEHTADESEHPAYDPDAGQRVLRSAAHRRAVRAEREACCGALRHLAHCCVAF